MKKVFSFLLVILMLLMLFATIMQDGDIIKEEERWTELSYTREIFLNQGEYFPLEISFRSQGGLEPDLVERYNYTGTVFISEFTITANTTEFAAIDKIYEESEQIGREWKTITFDDIESENLTDISTIEFIVTLFPHNLSLGVSEDVYKFTVDIAQEVDLGSVMPVTSLIFIPLLSIPLIIWIHNFLNRYYLKNITYRNMWFYMFYFPSYFIKGRLKAKRMPKVARPKSRWRFWQRTK